MGHSKTAIGILCGAAAGALWGLVFLAPELVPGFTPLHLTLGRYLCYGVLSAFLLGPRWTQVTEKLTLSDWMTLASLALIGNLLYYLFLSSAVQRTGMATTSLIIGLLPVVVSLVGSRDQGAVPLRKLTLPLSLCMVGACCVGIGAAAAPSPVVRGQKQP